MARGTPGLDYPEIRTPVDVEVGDRGELLLSWVEDLADDDLLVSLPQDRSGRRASAQVGEHVTLVWQGPGELRALPAQLREVLKGDRPRWLLRPLGPAARGQRRAHVRIPLALPVVVDDGALSGTTTDLSESGLHCILQAPPTSTAGSGTAGRASATGAYLRDTRLDVVLHLDDDRPPVRAESRVIRRHARTDDHVELSVGFLGLPEPESDRIRRRVFAAMRDLRSRGVL
jgi:PilZ domain